MTKLVITIAALAAMNAGRAHCQTTVDQWIALCLKGPSTAEHASCESYVRGVADALLSIQATRPQLSMSCIPAHVTANDLVTLALPYAQGQPPAARQLMGATLLIDVFREAFPCPQK
jgi:Rap1a immunity proteins